MNIQPSKESLIAISNGVLGGYRLLDVLLFGVEVLVMVQVFDAFLELGVCFFFGWLPYMSLLLQVVTDELMSTTDAFDVADQVLAFLIELVEFLGQGSSIRSTLTQHSYKK